METRNFYGGKTRRSARCRTASARMLLESRVQQQLLDLDPDQDETAGDISGGYQCGDILQKGSQLSLTENISTEGASDDLLEDSLDDHLSLQSQMGLVTPTHSDQSSQFSTPCFSSGRGYHSRSVPGVQSFTPASSFHSTMEPNRRDPRYTVGQFNLRSMLQEQQAMLKEVLTNQKLFETRQTNLEERLSKLESMSSSSSKSSSSDEKKKRVVTRALSVKVQKIHNSLDDSEQFLPEQRSTSPHNKTVKQKIHLGIASQRDSQYSDEVVSAAIKRCYQNIRRQWCETQSGKENYVAHQQKQRKYRSRRQRLFEKRSHVVTKKEQEQYWCHLSQAYMTEESDDTDHSNKIVQHKLRWRSDGLNKFIETLDRRIEMNVKDISGLVAKKQRVLGELSNSVPPIDAPSWAINGSHSGSSDQASYPVVSSETNFVVADQ